MSDDQCLPFEKGCKPRAVLKPESAVQRRTSKIGIDQKRSLPGAREGSRQLGGDARPCPALLGAHHREHRPAAPEPVRRKLLGERLDGERPRGHKRRTQGGDELFFGTHAVLSPHHKGAQPADRRGGNRERNSRGSVRFEHGKPRRAMLVPSGASFEINGFHFS